MGQTDRAIAEYERAVTLIPHIADFDKRLSELRAEKIKQPLAAPLMIVALSTAYVLQRRRSRHQLAFMTKLAMPAQADAKQMIAALMTLRDHYAADAGPVPACLNT